MASPGAAPTPAPAPARAPAAGAAHWGPTTDLYFFLVGAVAFIAVRLANGASLRDVVFPVIGALVYASLIWFHLSPPGSASARCARFALWVLTSCMNVCFAWVVVGPPTFEAGIWCFTAACVMLTLCILMFC